MHHRSINGALVAAAIFAAIAATLAACSTDEGTVRPSRREASLSYPAKGVVHWLTPMGWDEATVAAAAEADIINIPMAWCFSPDSRPLLEDLRSRNPDIAFIGYRTVISVSELWPDTVYLRQTLPYDLDYYYAVRDDWAWTTTGDTIMFWPGIMLLNPIKDGALNTALIDRMVGVLERYETASGGMADGIMHDYFMYAPYINPAMEERITGEIDLDGNGVTFYDDPNEQALFNEWQLEYARALRDRLGDRFIQIGNGRPPQQEAELAALLNGIFYELYPNFPWWRSDREGLLTLLGNQEPGWLTPARGRTWSILTNEQGGQNNMFALLSSLLAGCMYTELYGSYSFFGWTLSVECGLPTGETVVEGSMDSVLTVRRPFERGEVRIAFQPTGGRREALFDGSGGGE